MDKASLIVNPAYETAMDLKKILFERGIENRSERAAAYKFYVSDAAEKFTRFANGILTYDVASTHLIFLEDHMGIRQPAFYNLKCSTFRNSHLIPDKPGLRPEPWSGGDIWAYYL